MSQITEKPGLKSNVERGKKWKPRLKSFILNDVGVLPFQLIFYGPEWISKCEKQSQSIQLYTMTFWRPRVSFICIHFYWNALEMRLLSFLIRAFSHATQNAKPHFLSPLYYLFDVENKCTHWFVLKYNKIIGNLQKFHLTWLVIRIICFQRTFTSN